MTEIINQNFETKGWICLDIDGTITSELNTVPIEVINFLDHLQQIGWSLVFVTGRMFTFGKKPLEKLKFPYFYIPQNGASWYHMPSEKLGGKRYLPLTVFQDLEDYLTETQLDFVLFTGIESGDLCFYRPTRLKSETNQYFQNKLSFLGGDWRTIESYHQIDSSELAYGKIYGSLEDLKPVYELFSKIPSIKVHCVKDSASDDQYIIQIMRSDVDKGSAVLEIISKNTTALPIISAGNDYNDESMLEIADVKIAMKGSPQPLLDIATIIAPPVEDNGILPALELAIEKVKEI